MHFSKSATKKYITFVIIFVLLSVVMIPTTVKSQNLNEINVMLLNGKADYESIISLSSNSGLKITTNDPTPYSIQTKADEYISLQFNRYNLQLLETDNLAAIKQVTDQLKENKDYKLTPAIEVIELNNQVYYRLIAGSFDSLNEANNLKAELKGKIGIDGKTTGTLSWSVGSFANIDQATNQANQLKQKGYTAYVVDVLNSGKWEYQVWVGNSGTEAEHLQLKQAINSNFPDLTPVEAAKTAYVIHKQNGSLNSSNVTTNNLFVFPSTSYINLTPLDSQSITTVKERTYQGKSNKYRGEFKLQFFNKEMALVNKLTLESYLYSVVGSEVYNNWPDEALKAQAVAARTFAYNKLLYPRNQIAHIYDNTSDQAYYGIAQESPSVISAVDKTKGEVIISNGSPITAFYSSNAGGITSDGSEVWGNNIPYTKVATSEWDKKVLDTTMLWYRIIRSNGETGYIRSDLINVSAKTHELGLKYGMINADGVNFRTGPSTTRFPVINSLPNGEEIVILDTVYENNPYSWIAGPFTAEYMTENINKHQIESQAKFTGPILDLQVAERGPSGRVTLISNGNTPIPVKYPDYYRTLFGGLTYGVQSTLFDIEQTGRIEIRGEHSNSISSVNNKSQIYVQSAADKTSLVTTNNGQSEYLILGAENNLRVATKDQKYILHGNGFGHGIGMSQWGIKGMAESGYNYQGILQYYYNNIEIKKLY